MEILTKILNKEKIKAEKITKSTSGFTNQVFFVDEFVIKLTNDSKTKQQLEKEISVYKNIKLDNIPKYISSGEIEDYKYLIISKLNGKPLYSFWHTLDRATQKDIVSKVVCIIKEFHKQSADFLDNEYMYENCYKEQN